MKKLALLTMVLLFACQGIAETQQERPIDLDFSIKLMPFGLWSFDLPEELETIPHGYNSAGAPDGQEASADTDGMSFSSLSPSVGLNLLERLRLSYTLHGCFNWGSAGGNGPFGGENIHDYGEAYSEPSSCWFWMHELALDVIAYRTEKTDIEVGIAYTTTELEFERGWYDFGHWNEYATVSGDVEIYSGKVRCDINEETLRLFMELYFDYGKVKFANVEDGNIKGLRAAVGLYCF